MLMAAAANLPAAVPARAMGLGAAAELEHARANARAGGPVSERDFELLERHGCLSGTRSPACQPKPRNQQLQRTGKKKSRR
jgi:hypothetical protein